MHRVFQINKRRKGGILVLFSCLLTYSHHTDTFKSVKSSFMMMTGVVSIWCDIPACIALMMHTHYLVRCIGPPQVCFLSSSVFFLLYCISSFLYWIFQVKKSNHKHSVCSSFSIKENHHNNECKESFPEAPSACAAHL